MRLFLPPPLRPALAAALVALFALAAPAVLAARPASAVEAPGGQPPPGQLPPPGLFVPTPTPAAPAEPKATISLDPGQVLSKPSQSVTVILLLTLLSVAPALLVMVTSFTRTVIVLSITRNALGLQSIPPNQVVVGLALFLSLFIMSPTLSAMNREGLQPYLKGEKAQQQALDDGVVPLRQFMFKQTRKPELALFSKVAEGERPQGPDDVELTTLAPAFILSELKTAFIIGFIVFIPFLVIDLIVSSSLMSMGMMMLPPVLVSLPFKLLLFVLVDGWALVVRSLVTSFN